MDELQAIRSLKRGDIGGLEYLVSRYQVRAARVSFLVTHDDQLTEDVVQEMFVRFYHRVHQFDESRPFEPFFIQSVVNASLNAIEKEGRKIPFSAFDADELEDLLARASVEEEVMDGQRNEEILAALHRLPPRQRAVIVQRYYLEMSEQEMAQRLDIAPGTVKWLLNAARTKLRGLLGSERSS